MEQYKTSRDPKELLFQFKKRALVHFTLDPDEVYFTTKLDSTGTRFFPFNKGYKNAAGNPPAKDYATYRTAYFWEEMLSVDSWLELIGRFLHIQKEDFTVDGKKILQRKLTVPPLSSDRCSTEVDSQCQTKRGWSKLFDSAFSRLWQE